MSDDASLAAHDRYAERVLFALNARRWARLALAAKTDWIAIDRAKLHFPYPATSGSVGDRE
jgi:hypothetical protein